MDQEEGEEKMERRDPENRERKEQSQDHRMVDVHPRLARCILPARLSVPYCTTRSVGKVKSKAGHDGDRTRNLLFRRQMRCHCAT
jgi:hypothetical protein